MKKIQLSISILLLVSIFLLPIQTATAQLKTTLEGHTDLVWSVAFSPNGQTLASGSRDTTIRLWNSNTGNLKRILREHTDEVLSVVFSPDGRTLASGSLDETIGLWNPNNGNLKRTLRGHRGGVSSVVFSPDGQTLASGSWDGTIGLWNPNNGNLKRTLRGHRGGVSSVVFSPDGQTLASGSIDQTIYLWNPNNGRHIKTLTGHTGEIPRIMFSPDGRTLASGSRDQTVRLWNPNNGEHKNTLTHRSGWGNTMAFSPDGATLLVGGYGISIWDTQTGEYKKALAEDIGTAMSVVFSPDGQMVASGSADHKVRLWEFNASDYEFPSITTNGMVRLVYFLPNDRPVRPDRMEALGEYIKDTQEFYADEMERHGYGRKTFTLETDKAGELVVHHIDGKFPAEHYYKDSIGYRVWEDTREHFDAGDFQHIYFIAIDSSSERTDGGQWCGEASLIFSPLDGGEIRWRSRDIIQEEEILGGFSLIPASGDCLKGSGHRHRLGLPAHELGHAFGLEHDFRQARNSDYIMAYGSQSRLAKCSAEWLSVSRFFNTEPISSNIPAEIQLLSVGAYSKDTISIHFKVTDPDGLHQAHLLLPDITQDGAMGPYRLFDCIPLNSKTSAFVSAVRAAELVDRVTLQIIDVNGNITWATFPIKLDAIFSDQNVLDINSDGTVNISDLTSVASRFGQRGQNPADVNEDRVVDTADLLLIAASLSSLPRQAVETLAAADVQKWLIDAKQLRIENEYQLKGIVFLEHLLAEIALSLTPRKVGTDSSKAIFEAHTDVVHSVAFSSDSQMLASASEDNTIRLWDTQTAALKTLLIGHTQPVNGIAFSPDGQTLASVSPDTTIRLWNPRNGQLKTTLRVHTGFTYLGFLSVAFSPDSQTLATGGDYYSDFTVRLWDLHNEENIRTFTGHTGLITSVAFSPDGRTLASGSEDKTIRLWNPNNGNLKTTLAGHRQMIDSVAFSPDGQTLASGSRDGTIRLWDPETGKLRTTLTGYTGWINPLAFSPDGEMLASGSHDQRIRFWNAKTDEYKNAFKGHTGHIFSVAFSPDGTTLASGSEDGTVRLWELIPDDTLSDKRIEDVNGDGVVNILDLVSVSANFGKTGPNIADVNGDGIVNIVDLVKVAGEMGTGAAAPAAHPQTLEILTATDVQHWLAQAQSFGLTDATSQRGILMLQQLLAALIPKDTSLLPNYPNPFNPETWIPYQLSKPADVTLTIYAVDGEVVRQLALGYQAPRMYHSKNQAVYWDGKNEVGEQVASGIYFYTLIADDFIATRKMLILK